MILRSSRYRTSVRLRSSLVGDPCNDIRTGSAPGRVETVIGCGGPALRPVAADTAAAGSSASNQKQARLRWGRSRPTVVRTV